MASDRPRILVTGADGFVAKHLLPFFHAQGAELFGTVFRPDTVLQNARAVPLDITDAERTRDVVRDIRPTHIVHLAAVSSVRDSFSNVSQTTDVNVLGTEHLFDAAGSLSSSPRVLVIGSGEEYGPNDGQPLTESSLSVLHPVSPYGVSKKTIEEKIERSPALSAMTIRTRSFPHIGPGQSGRFFIPEVADQIIQIERGMIPPEIGVGNLDAVRDFTDVRDIVRAYWLLLKHGQTSEVYNVCSGTGRVIRDVLRELLDLAAVRVQVRQDPAKMRPVDIPILIGDNRKIKEAMGWIPAIPLRQTLTDVLTDARNRRPS